MCATRKNVLYGVTYRSKFSQGIFPIEKLIFMSEINEQGPLLLASLYYALVKTMNPR